MRTLTALTVGLLVVLAGCNAVPGGGAPGTTPGTTVSEATTAAPTTTETTPTTADSTTGTAAESTTGTTAGPADESGAALPPGLSTTGVTDATALAAAHEEALAGKSYTYDREVRVVADNGTALGGWSQHAQVGAERLQFNHTQTGTGVSVSGLTIKDFRVYTNGSATYNYWNTSGPRGGYWKDAGRGFAANTFSSEQLLADALDAAETTVGTVRREDRRWYRVRAENGSQTFDYRVPNASDPVRVNATNVTATALVAPDGLVRNVTYEYDFVRGDVSGHRTMTVQYAAVGETEVAVPAWVEQAREETNATMED